MTATKEWPDAEYLRLLDLIKERPIVWDNRTEAYRLIEEKEQTWVLIADECKTTTGQ
jgi:hypothetical protein